MSSTDENMVYGWVTALGRPIWYSIVVDNKFVHYYCHKEGGKFFADYHGTLYEGRGLNPYHGEILKMVLSGLSCARNDFSDPAELSSVAMEVNAVFKNASVTTERFWDSPEFKKIKYDTEELMMARIAEETGLPRRLFS